MAGYLLAVAILFCIQGWSSPQKEETYLQVYRNSSCQPREMLVNVHKEHPRGTNHFFKPSCVVLQRCGGCCNDEGLKCFSVKKRTINLPIMRVNASTQASRIERMNFREHLMCECRPQEENRMKNRMHEEPRKRGAERQAPPCLTSL